MSESKIVMSDHDHSWNVYDLEGFTQECRGWSESSDFEG